jgi:hypothetical protein
MGLAEGEDKYEDQNTNRTDCGIGLLEENLTALKLDEADDSLAGSTSLLPQIGLPSNYL